MIDPCPEQIWHSWSLAPHPGEGTISMNSADDNHFPRFPDDSHINRDINKDSILTVKARTIDSTLYLRKCKHHDQGQNLCIFMSPGDD